MANQNEKQVRCGRLAACIKNVLTNPLTYVLLAAIAFRVIYFHTLRPYSETADSPTYKELGNILTGLRTPVYPLLLAGLNALFGEPLMNMVLVRLQSLATLCALGAFYYTVVRVTHRRYLAVIFTLWFGCQPGVVGYETSVMTESLSISGVVFLVFLLARYLEQRRKSDALGMGLLTLFLILLRPGFLYLVPVLAVFWALQWFLEAKEKNRHILWGVAGTALSLAGVLAWCTFNFFSCGRFTLSVVTDINLLHMLVLNGSVENPEYPELSEFVWNKMVENQEDSAYLPWGAYEDITAAYPDEWAEYASSTLKYHVGDMTDYTITKVGKVLKEPFLNDQPYVHLWYYTYFGASVRTLLFNANVTQVLQFLFVELVYSFTWWAVKKKINWLGLGLAGCTLATMATALVGAQAEWYRLWLPSFPFLILLGSLWAYRICVWLGRPGEQPQA